jgi:hypothetical protein
MTIQNSIGLPNKCPSCRKEYEIYVFKDLVGKDVVDDNGEDAYDTHMRNDVRNAADRFMVVIFGNQRFAIKRKDNKRIREGYDGYVSIYEFQSFNRDEKKLMMSVYDRMNPVGKFNGMIKKVKIFNR